MKLRGPKKAQYSSRQVQRHKKKKKEEEQREARLDLGTKSLWVISYELEV